MSELDGLNGNTVIAEYVPGPVYVDDTVAVRRDLDLPRNGIQSDEVFYYLTDQQYSTVALLDAGGNVVERYGYDAFGAPSIHNADATATLGQSAVGNSRLYTGRDYLPALGLYDYLQRLYDPAAGRFVTTDPIGNFGDPNNLGNPYTYVGNNPGSFVDPFGLESWAQYFWSVYTEPVYAFFGGNLGGDNSQAHDRYLERQSLRSDPRLNVDSLGSGDTRYAPNVGPQLGQAFDETLKGATRSGLAGAQFLPGPAGLAANAIGMGDDAGQGNWGSAILGGIGAIGSVRGIGESNTCNLTYNSSLTKVSKGEQLEFPFPRENGRKTYLYQKLGPSGEHLKFGVSMNPNSRYSQSEIGAGRLKILASGERDEMLRLERNLHETLPLGPEEYQSIYFDIQKTKGYTNPHKE